MSDQLSMRDRAVALARQGFSVFPLPAGKKSPPLVPEFKTKPPKGRYHQHIPTDDPALAYAMWTARDGESLDYNIGINTNRLLVVDVDNKNGKNGESELATLWQRGVEIDPGTLEVTTPTGGRHLYYDLPAGVSIASTKERLAPGIDTRSWNGYVVAPGSRVAAGEYKVTNDVPAAVADESLIRAHQQITEQDKQPKAGTTAPGVELDSPDAIERARRYCRDEAEDAIETCGGREVTKRILFRLGDMGLSASKAVDVLCEHWNPEKASPSWDYDQLLDFAEGIEGSRENPLGCDHPLACFNVVPEVESGEGSSTTAEMPPLTLSWWAGRDLPEPEFICGQWLTTTSRVILNAPTGLGKSVFTVSLGVAVAAQKDFLHWKAGAKPYRVLYIDGEMSNRLLKQRLADEARRVGCVPETFYALSHEDMRLAPLNTPDGQKQIDAVITNLGGVDLILFDNVMSLIPGDQKEEEAWAKVMPWIRSLTRRSIGQVWVHHTGHNKQHGYGTKTREWQLDTVMHLTEVKRPDTDVSFEIEFHKARERTPARRADFVNKKVALLRDQWEGGAAVDFTPRLTNEQQEWNDRLGAHVEDTGLDVFTREDMQKIWSQPADVVFGAYTTPTLIPLEREAARVRIKALEGGGVLGKLAQKAGKPTLYLWGGVTKHHP